MMTRLKTDVGRRIVAGVMPLVMAITVGACGGAAPSGAGAPAEEHPAPLPPGYALRLDRSNRDRSDFAVRDLDGDLIVETGPAGILYRPDDLVDTDDYAVRGRFTEVGAPMGHREGFGLFIGGQQLGAAGQRYIYFLVRGDGRYLVKQRDGDTTIELSQGWQSSDAVRVPAGAGGEVANELVMEVDEGQLRLSCNGELVADLAVASSDTRGVAGVRVNHNLRVRIGDFGVRARAEHSGPAGGQS